MEPVESDCWDSDPNLDLLAVLLGSSYLNSLALLAHLFMGFMKVLLLESCCEDKVAYRSEST